MVHYESPISRAMSYLGGAAFLVAGVGAQAQPGDIQEVVVSAERVDEPLSRTPVSIGVLSSDDIERRGITQLSDLQGQIAGVVVPNGFSNQPQSIVIRGVGGSAPALSQAVALYVDDVPLIRGYATALWDLPDIQRIEVLRGPQGTLYGQNSTAGAVHIVSYQPSAQPIAWASVGGGNYAALETRGYLNGSIGGADSPLVGSLAVSHSQNDGFGYNEKFDARVNRLDATQARAQLKFSPTRAWNFLLAVDGLLDTSDTNTQDYPLNDPRARPRVTFSSLADGAFRRWAGGVSLTSSVQLSSSTLKAVTAFRTYTDDPTRADIGGLETPRFELDQTITQKAFSQELEWQGKVDAFSWTTGVLVVADHFVFDRFSLTQPLTAPAASESEALSRFRTVDAGIYGQVKYALSSTMNVTIGLRAYRTRQSGSNQLWSANAQYQRTGVIYDAGGLSKTNHGLIPRVGIDKKFSEDLFTYLTFAKGDKFGGFNRAAQSLTSASYAANPEHVSTIEAGAKATAMAKKLSFSAAVFYNDYRDYLATLNNATINGTLVTDQVLINAGRARTYGVDFDTRFLLFGGTNVTGSVELLRSKFLDFLNPSGKTNYVGNELPSAPRVTFGASVDQQFLVLGDLGADVEAAVRVVGHNFTEASNNPALAAPTAAYLDLAGSVAATGSRWLFSVRVRNALNKTYGLLRVQVPPLGVDSTFYNPPRTYMLTARYAFL